MTFTLQITKKLRFFITLLYWNLLPTHDKLTSAAQEFNYYSWGCFRFESIKLGSFTQTQNGWSDEEVVRQMKNLEKEVEATKTKPKPSIKRK